MTAQVGMAVSLAFVVLALWHFGMAFSLTPSGGGAMPSVDGKPLFRPSRAATAAVGVVLLLFAVLMAATAGLVRTGLPHALLTWLSYALAAGLLARAIGEFNYLGFFKRVRGSRFATLDTLLYSPLCVVLATGAAFVAWHSGG
jgi:Protein of unknown function (DUF3995)